MSMELAVDLPHQFGQFLDPAFRYDYSRGPRQVQDIEDARRNGINCVSLAHLAIQALFGRRLPKDLHCAELFGDRQHFEPVASLDESVIGDLLWFGVENPPIKPEEFKPVYDGPELTNFVDFPVKHVGINTGIVANNGEPLVLHSTNKVGTNTIWPLPRFQKHERYRQLYGISRLIKSS